MRHHIFFYMYVYVIFVCIFSRFFKVKRFNNGYHIAARTQRLLVDLYLTNHVKTIQEYF